VRYCKFAIAVCLTLAFLAPTLAARDYHHSRTVVITEDGPDFWENTSFDLDRGTVVITHREDRGKDVVEITKDHRLIINDDEIKLDDRQQALVGEFHEGCMEIYKSAKKIGWEGAKIGLDGAKLGIQAVGCVFKLLSPEYDSDDLERELEHEADKIEAKAEILELQAEQIEAIAEELEDIADDMRRDIPEIDDLGWF